MQQKIAQYEIEPENTYNMDENSFMARVIGKSKRVFAKSAYEQKCSWQSLHNGNGEWITLLACVCTDRFALPPGLIFAAESKNIQSTWIADMEKKSTTFTVRCHLQAGQTMT